jgi:hypothetical protein
MNINASIIDMRVQALAEQLAPELEARLNIKNDEVKRRSTAFVFLVAKTILDLPDDETLDCLTEGGNDFGVDAIHIGDLEDGEFVVTLFQGKYKQDLSGDSNFPQSGVEKMIQAIRYLFDPAARLTLNLPLQLRVEELRSLIRDGGIPRVRAILCNNGCKWSNEAQALITQSGFPKDQVIWDHVNHDELVRILQAIKPVDDILHLTGKAFSEDFNYCRVLIGKISVSEVAALFNRHGNLLLERNIRRFLGLQGNRVNQEISRTLQSQEQCNFYFYNNGITFICTKFNYNSFQREDFQVQVKGLQVINGGQTCKTIQSTLSALAGAEPGLEKAFVLIRLYELPTESEDLIRNITYATNCQNPVDLRDLRSNDQRQRNLVIPIHELGYTYHRHRSDTVSRPTDITSATAAEAVLSVWRNRPHQAKYQGREHFGKLYEIIFTDDLNAAQVIIATLLFRITENKRKRPPEGMPDFIVYGSCFLAMLMGKYLLSDLGITLQKLNHLNFETAKTLVETKNEAYYQRAVEEIKGAISGLYGKQELSLQRLAATFRRGDLLEELNRQP